MASIFDGNEIYYKLYLSSSGFMTVVTMQWFDEADYVAEKFVKDKDGRDYKFETEQEAIDKLNEWYKFEEINPEYRNRTTNFLTR
jgi:hypothetical protein